jgi:hypothetical protein
MDVIQSFLLDAVKIKFKTLENIVNLDKMNELQKFSVETHALGLQNFTDKFLKYLKYLRYNVSYNLVSHAIALSLMDAVE